MTASLPGGLSDAVSDLRTARFETDPHRQGQYARSAADSATEVAADSATSEADRARALTVVDTALVLAARSLLHEAQSTLSDARGTDDPRTRRELARSAVSKGQQVARQRGISDDERAAARQVIGHGRMLSMTVKPAELHVDRDDRDLAV